MTSINEHFTKNQEFFEFLNLEFKKPDDGHVIRPKPVVFYLLLTSCVFDCFNKVQR